MKFKLTISMITMGIFSLAAQSSFEPGILIDKNGDIKNVLINNKGWENAPRYIEYKNNDSSITLKLFPADVQEVILNNARYLSTPVRLDITPDRINLQENREPDFENREVFLEVLLEGKASLYRYQSKEVVRFFFSSSTSPLTQLVYREYISKGLNYDNVSAGTIKENNQFRQQLYNHVRCSDFKDDYMKSVRYSPASLIRYFTRYNRCENSPLNIYYHERKYDFRIYTKAVMNVNSFNIFYDDNSFRNLDFSTKLSFAPAVEAELIFPFYNYRWSLLMEVTYNSYQDTERAKLEDAFVNISTLGVAFGLRYYIISKNHFSLFANVHFMRNNLLGETRLQYIYQNKVSYSLPYRSTASSKVGAGILYHSILLQVGYSLPHHFFVENGFPNENSFNQSFVMIGYRFF